MTNKTFYQLFEVGSNSYIVMSTDKEAVETIKEEFERLNARKAVIKEIILPIDYKVCI